MIRYLACAALFVLGGCASSPALKITAPAIGEEKLMQAPVPGIARLKVRLVSVESAASMKAMVENRRNYRLEFFRQSKDPYFGKDRWSADCLKRNPTGALTETSDGFSFRSKSTADASLKTEVCLQDSIDVVQLVGECRKQKIVYEVTAVGEKAELLAFHCPDEIRF